MSRYIDAEEVEKRIDIVIGSEPKAWDKKALKELKMYVVHAVPTADVVEVVRCKDCKHHAEFSSKCNKLNLTPMWPNDYCSYGERADT